MKRHGGFEVQFRQAGWILQFAKTSSRVCCEVVKTRGKTELGWKGEGKGERERERERGEKKILNLPDPGTGLHQTGASATTTQSSKTIAALNLTVYSF